VKSRVCELDVTNLERVERVGRLGTSRLSSWATQNVGASERQESQQTARSAEDRYLALASTGLSTSPV
jgi:hypothetical protein